MKSRLLISILLAGASVVPAMAQGYRDGIEYYKADRVTEAEELLLRNLNNADTDKAASYYYLGLINIDRYNYSVRQNKANASYKNEALKYFNDGVAANPNYPFNYIGLGQLDLLNNSNKAAEDNFKTAEKLGKKDAGVLAGIARAYYNVNPNLYAKQIDKYRESAKKLVVSRVVSKNSDFKENDADYYIFEGDMLFDSANGNAKIVGDACNMYEQAIGIDPTTGEGYVKYADKYFTIKRNDHAIAKLEEMLKQNPNSALAQRELSEKLYSDGQVARATEQYSKLIENPNHFASDEVRYLTLLYFNKDYEKGYTQATKILSKDSDNFTARRFQYIFANLLDKDNKVELAEQLVALKSDKNKFATGDYSMIATDFIKAGKTDEALALLETGMKDYPEENGILKGAADAYKNAEMYDKAADTLSQYTASQGSNVNGQDLWSLSNYALIAGTKTTDQTQIDKYFNMSSDAAKQAIDKFADESKYMAAMRIADVAKYSKKESEALAAYEQAATLMENAGVTDDTKSAKNIYRYLTVGYYNKHDNAKAKQYLNKYLQYDSNDADINKIKNALK